MSNQLVIESPLTKGSEILTAREAEICATISEFAENQEWAEQPADWSFDELKFAAQAIYDIATDDTFEILSIASQDIFESKEIFRTSKTAKEIPPSIKEFVDKTDKKHFRNTLLRDDYLAEHPEMAWKADRNCNGVDPDVFYPETDDKTGIAFAKKICAGCIVNEICLEIGMKEKYGIWGGKTEAERSTIKRRQRREARKQGV